MARRAFLTVVGLCCLTASGCNQGGLTTPQFPQGSAAPSSPASPGVTATPSAIAVSPSPAPSATALATNVPTASPTPAASASASASATPAATATPATAPASIYLGDLNSGGVLIYPSNANGTISPYATIGGTNTGITNSNGTTPLYGFTVDPGGNVYVLTQTANSGNVVTAENVFVFNSGTYGNVAPSRTISLPTTIDAEAIAYYSGNLYIADDAGNGAIDVLPANASGSVTFTRTFTPAGGFGDPASKISFDPSGNVYVSTLDITATAANEAKQGVFEFAAGASGTVSSTTLTGSSTGLGSGVLESAVVDSAARIDAVVQDSTNDLYADIDEFAAHASGNVAPATSFQDTNGQGPIDGAVDAMNQLYVTLGGPVNSSAEVDVFANGANTASQRIMASNATLPLVTIGPFVAANASGANTFGSARRATAMSVRAPLHLRAGVRSFTR